MQYIPCNSALLAQETLFLSKDFQKARKSQQILILRQNNVCWGLKFSSEIKLFGEGLRTTSATMHNMRVIVLSLNLVNSLVGKKGLNFIICLLAPLALLPCQYSMVFLPIGGAGQGCFFIFSIISRAYSRYIQKRPFYSSVKLISM